MNEAEIRADHISALTGRADASLTIPLPMHLLGAGRRAALHAANLQTDARSFRCFLT